MSPDSTRYLYKFRQFFFNNLALMFIAVFLSIFIGCNNNPKNKIKSPLVPSMSFINLSNKVIRTDDIPVGAPFVLFYFGPFCDHSRKQMQSIIRYIDVLENVKFYLISSADLYDVNWFSNSFRLGNYKNILILRDTSNVFVNSYKVSSTPYIIIYGSDKRLLRFLPGEVYGRDIKKIIENN